MRNPLLRLSCVVFPLTLLAMSSALLAQTPPGGFAETFALAPDRAAALAQLIPGTEDAYYYQCLQKQHEGALDAVPVLLAAWVERHGRTSRVEEIEVRQALLSYERDEKGTYAWLQQRLGLSFDQQRQVPGQQPELPTQFDNRSIAAAQLLQRALALHSNSLDGLTDRGLAALLATKVPDNLLRELLNRLQRSDVPGLALLVARELRLRDSGGFGSLRVHEFLLQSQLDEVLQQVPNLRDDRRYVDEYVRRLRPNADVAWQVDVRAREAYLDALLGFVERLSPVHNSLKSHVLFHRLRHDLELGKVDTDRLGSYLRLPRRAGYANPEWIRKSRGQDIVDDGFRSSTGLDAVGSDEELVRACFEQIFATADTIAPWTEHVREDWLRRVFAETKILLGQGDMERWYSMLADPSYYEQLVQRVELSFAKRAQQHFAADAKVTIELDVKNVPTLLVKVYRIDAYAYLKAVGKDVDASIDLDGVVANEEQVVQYSEPPLRRVRRQFQPDSLNQPGTYVVEFVGNGMSSRAVVQKGRLDVLSRIGAAGHVFSVFDENGQPVRDAVAFCAGREIVADDRGELAVPFSPEPAQRTIVVRRGAVATLHRFAHAVESAELRLAAFVDRESLRGGEPSRLLLRPRFEVGGVPVSLALLQEPEFVITARLRDGAQSMQTIAVAAFDSNGEYVHDFEVPRGLVSLSVAMRARYQKASTGQTVDVQQDGGTFVVNGIEATAEVAASILGREQDGWFVEVRGRTGEPLATRTVELSLRHCDFRDQVQVVLQSDAAGKVALGALEGIDEVRLLGSSSVAGSSWFLVERRAWPKSLQGIAGATLRVAYPENGTQLDASIATLVERRDDRPVRDASALLALTEGWLELRAVPAGDYVLRLPRFDVEIDVAVTNGTEQGRFVLGATRALLLRGQTPLAILRLDADADTVSVRLGNAGASARVHAFATRYLPAFDAFALALPPVYGGASRVLLEPRFSDYAAERRVGDELRYVFERRYATKFPGNMLQRPSLLLNPWAIDRASDTGRFGGGAGGGYGRRRGGRAEAPPAETANSMRATGSDPNAYATIDFLDGATSLLANLRPDANGTLRIPRKDLGAGQLLHVIAVDGDDFDYRSVAMPLKALDPRDLRLPKAFDAAQHLAEQQRIEFVAAGSETRVPDVATTKLRPFTSLQEVHRLLGTLVQGPDLADFAFVTRWPSLTADERLQLYRTHACHELHLFLYFKDRAFFDSVLKPYLANKAHREFLDDWMLGEDVASYLEPARFATLNLVERILLLQRLPGQREALVRHARELGELEPIDLEGKKLVFRAALRTADLDAGAEGDAKTLLGLDVVDRLERKLSAAEPSAGGPASAGPAGPATGRRAADPGAPAPKPESAEKAKQDLSASVEQGQAGGLLTELTDKDAELAKEDDEQDRERRKVQRSFFRDLDPTRIFAESYYWKMQRTDETADRIRANSFWRDFAASQGTPFVSPNVAEARGSFTEAMFALAVLDLPFEGKQPSSVRDGAAATLRTEGPLLLARSEILPVVQKDGIDPVLIRQACFRLDDRYSYDGNVRRQKSVTSEFTAGVVYGSQIVLTNPTEAPRTLSLLIQIPAGALPLQGGFATHSVPLQLDAFATTTFEFSFYFPLPGDFAHYPAQVSADGVFVGAAEAAVRHVVATPTVVDSASWDHVSQMAEADAVLEYLRTHNLRRVDLSRIAWRLRDRVFFGKVVELLRSQLQYDDTVWSFGVRHGDLPVAREYLARRADLGQSIGYVLRSPLLTVEPLVERAYEHLEFDPLVHARAHRIGAWQGIQNRDVTQQWQQCLAILCRRPQLAAADWAEVTYYHLVQGRTEDALAAFARIDRESLTTALQYDYLAAYLAFFRADVAAARSIASVHKDHPVDRWRTLFRSVLQQADEIDGAAVVATDEELRDAQQTQLAATEPQLDVVVEGGVIAIRHRNLEVCEVRYHRLDVEFAFSNSPFQQQGLAAVGWVEPMRKDAVELGKGAQQTTVPLPAEFAQGNVVIEVRGGGLVRRAQSLASTMVVQAIGSYGQVEVRSQKGAPLAKVYVKCYARGADGSVRFHKDGYTDLRGRFDYVSVSESGSSGAQRYALLVLSETDGAVLRELDAPNR